MGRAKYWDARISKWVEMAPTAEEFEQLEVDLGDKAALSTNNKENLVSAINEVFQLGNNRKESLVDLLLSLDDSLPINYNSTWENILSALENISTGKKFAMGNETIVTIGKDNFPYLRDGYGNLNSEYIQIMEVFDFEPSIIIIASDRVGTSLNGFTTIAFKNIGVVPNLVLSVYSTGASSGANSYTLKLDGTKSYMNDNGFKVPVNRNNVTAISNYTWLAIE